jgi:DNA-binding NarL/FixJ family response regulator
LRVLIVDDSRVFLRSLHRLLASLPGTEVVGEATSARDAMGMVDHLSPDLVLLDVTMPDMDGLEATRQLRTRRARPRIVVMSIHDLPEYRDAAQTAGADAFVSKLDLGDHLQWLIRHLISQSGDDRFRPS